MAVHRALKDAEKRSVRLPRGALRLGALLRGFLRRGCVPVARSSDGVAIAPFLGNCLSAACISADFELSWAFRSLGAVECQRRALAERNNVPWLVAVFDQLETPITWATVGHLFLERCQSRNGVAHPDMPRPSGSPLWEGDWYKHDPCSGVQQAPLWYAPDLIELILSAKQKHEIGTHSFSHIDYSPGTSNQELVRRELEETVAAMAPFGLRARSHVFPFNRMGPAHLSTLGGGGITAVRWRDPALRLSYPVRTADGVHKLVESLNLRRPRFCSYVDLARTFLDQADLTYGAFNAWFHPSEQRALLEEELIDLLRLLQARSRTGRTWVTTMSGLAAYCEARERTEIATARSLGRIVVRLSSTFNVERYGPASLTLTVDECVRSARLISGPNSAQRAVVPFIAQGLTCITVPHDASLVELVI